MSKSGPGQRGQQRKRSKRSEFRKQAKGVRVDLSRVLSIRTANELVEMFRAFSCACGSADGLLDSFERYRTEFLARLRVPHGERQHKLDADILLIDSSGQLQQAGTTRPEYDLYLPNLRLRFTDGVIDEPQNGEGLAPYVVWANSVRRVGVGVVREVNAVARNAEFWKERRSERGEIDYESESVGDRYKPPPSNRTPPYQTILSAPIAILKTNTANDPLQRDALEFECIGVLNITHDESVRFSVSDCHWAQTCAGLLGVMHDLLRIALARLGSTGDCNDLLLRRMRKPQSSTTESRLPSRSTPTIRVSPMKILFLSANPIDALQPLDLEQELRQVQGVLEGVRYRDRISVIHQPAATSDDVVKAMRAHAPSVVHFSGHGSKSGIALRAENGKPFQSVSAEALAFLFEDRGVQLVVFNSCYSVAQTMKLSAVVGATIGTTSAVADSAALNFSRAFYRTIGDGYSVKDALRDGQSAVILGADANVFHSHGNLEQRLVSDSSLDQRPIDLRGEVRGRETLETTEDLELRDAQSRISSISQTPVPPSPRFKIPVGTALIVTTPVIFTRQETLEEYVRRVGLTNFPQLGAREIPLTGPPAIVRRCDASLLELAVTTPAGLLTVDVPQDRIDAFSPDANPRTLRLKGRMVLSAERAFVE